MKRKIGIAFVTLGLALIFFSVALLFYNNYENRKAEKHSNEVIRVLIDIIDNNQTNETNETNEEIDPFDTEMKVVDIDGYGYIGYLDIPEFNLNLPVMSEWDYSRLQIAPCRYYGSTKTDNLVICAHNYSSHFGYIEKLSPNSTIMFTDMEGTKQLYTVTSVEILQPTDVDMVKDTDDDLILYTCTYSGRTRVVVRCTEI